MTLWDRLFADNPKPDEIDHKACTARLFRAAQIKAEIEGLARMN
jgi:hypothetical protein